MAKEEWTVLFDIKSAGNIEPAVWAEKKLKVVNGAAETKEKNEGGVNRQPGANIKTNVVQEAKIVTVIAESAEEAVLAVRKYYAAGGKTAAEAGQLETAGVAGPIGNFVNASKWAAAVTGNLTEVTVR